MPRRKRIQKSHWIYFVTNRCFQAKYILRPDDEVNAIIRYWLKRAVIIYDVELFGAVVMSNHFHLIVRAPKKNLHQFMAYFQRNVARAVNLFRKRYDSVFPRRYSAEPILDDDALRNKMRYLILNPVKANLVGHPDEWPGYSTWKQMIGEADEEEADTPPITQLPMWEHLTAEEYAHVVKLLVEPECDRLEALREEGGRRLAGVDHVLNVPWYHRPPKPKRSPRPVCHASEKETWKNHRDYVTAVTERYQYAMEKWWSGEAVAFPKGTIPPGWSCCSDGTTKANPYRTRDPAA